MATPEGTGQDQQAGGSGCLVRLFWFFGGNVILFFSAGFIAQRREVLVSAWDAVFWATVLAMAAVRYLDIARFHGTTASGQPATMRHWRRYVALLAAIALAVWLAAHAWARFAGG